AELTEMASGMITSIGSSGETLDRLHNIVEEERSKAAGRVRVARDTLDTSGVQVKEAEQKALADQALADFAAKEGIPLDIAASADPNVPETTSTKTMGPAGMEKAEAEFSAAARYIVWCFLKSEFFLGFVVAAVERCRLDAIAIVLVARFGCGEFVVTVVRVA